MAVVATVVGTELVEGQRASVDAMLAGMARGEPRPGAAG